MGLCSGSSRAGCWRWGHEHTVRRDAVCVWLQSLCSWQCRRKGLSISV